MYSRAYVEITNICNMSCSFCHGHSRPPRRMSEEEFSQVLDRLSGHTKYIYYHLMGEPLTHPELPRFIEMAREGGFLSVITTNGTLLSRRGAELISAMPHKISISLHSFEGDSAEAHERYLCEVSDFAERASRAGIIVVLRLWNSGCDGGNNTRVMEYLRAHICGEWAENTKGIRIHDKLHIEFGERFVWPDREAPVQGEQVFCYGLRDHFGILCDGRVVPCCLDSDGVIELGNIFESPLSDILCSERARHMVEGFERRTPTEELCRRCSYAQRFI